MNNHATLSVLVAAASESFQIRTETCLKSASQYIRCLHSGLHDRKQFTLKHNVLLNSKFNYVCIPNRVETLLSDKHSKNCVTPRNRTLDVLCSRFNSGHQIWFRCGCFSNYIHLLSNNINSHLSFLILTFNWLEISARKIIEIVLSECNDERVTVIT